MSPLAIAAIIIASLNIGLCIFNGIWLYRINKQIDKRRRYEE